MTQRELLQRLLHRPRGLEHPYEQDPVERFPRDPVVGQSVTLGAATSPPGAAEAVWATWRTDDSTEDRTTQGFVVRDDAEMSYWQIPLPALDAGRTVTYRLHARGSDQQLKSDAFSFVVASPCVVGEVIRSHFRPDCVKLVCKSSNPEWQARVKLTFPADHIVHLTLDLATPSEGAGDSVSSASVGHEASTDKVYKVVEDGPDRIVVGTQGFRVTIHRHPYSIDLSNADGTTILVEEEPWTWAVGDDDRPLQVSQSFASPSDEAFYGFGERYNALNQRSNKLDVRVFDQYKSQRLRTYLPVPFFISSRGYAMYLDTSRHVAYDLAASNRSTWSYDAEVGRHGVLEAYIIVGPPKRAIASFADLTAKPALPPLWAFGPWMSGNDWNSQGLVMERVRNTVEHGIPASVLVLEAWSDEATFYIWKDAQYESVPADRAFTYDDFTFPPKGRWPDPKAMIEEIHGLGIRVLLWQIPVMRRLGEAHEQHDIDEMYMIEHGYCVRGPDGDPYRVSPSWFHESLVLDVTSDEALEWWLQKRAYLLDELEVDGFKTDGGEHMWGKELRFADGRRGEEMWNLYPNLYVGAYHRFAQQKRSGDAVTFSRAGTTGAQAFPCHWAGDEDSTWPAFGASILAGLNAGMSGISFWGWDLGGFSGAIPTADLYLRSTAMAAFCPIMQYHSEFNGRRSPCRDRTPWNIAERTGDPSVIPVYRFYANLRMNLLPYIYSEAWHSSQTGLPLMRPLWVEHPDDPICEDIEDQYYFGAALLVAPVIEEDARGRTVYLPRGRWYDLWDQTVYTGGKWIDYAAPADVMPAFVREAGIVPLNLGKDRQLGTAVNSATDQYDNLAFRVYPVVEPGEYTWFDGLTSSAHVFALRPAPSGGLVIDVPPLPYTFTLLVMDSGFEGVAIDGRSVRQVEPSADPVEETWCRDDQGWVRVIMRGTDSPTERTVRLDRNH